MTGRAAGRAVVHGRILAVAAAVALAACSTIFGDSVPRRDGLLDVAGLTGPVEILRDRYGVPHITAADDHDLYFAQGFVHAQDRLFQMDAERRLARGELAEVLGEPALPADRLFRHLGFAARAPGIVASWSAETREIVGAYCAGVNAAMESLAAWPAEYRILRAAPRPFAPEDVAAVGLLKSIGLSQWQEEALLHRIRIALPGEKGDEFLPVVPGGAPVVVPAYGPPGAEAPPSDLLREGFAAVRDLFGDFSRSGGSNAWAVAGRKSATGRPILASDPHLLLSCPSLFYENHLVAPGVDVYGVSFPGAPCVVIGHNPAVAWGLTNAMLDDADFFIERVEGSRVMHRNRWVPIATRNERILVRGGREELLTVGETPHGPLVSPVLPGASAALALRWAGFDGGDPVRALHALNRARNREEFLAAAALFPFPAQNVVYADRDGHIGVVLAGRIPLRKGGIGVLPVPGDSGEWEWRGYVPFRENPRVFDPPEGFVAAANFPTAGRSYPHYLSRVYEPADRGRRIIAILAGRDTFTVDKFERMQADVRRPGAAGAVALGIGAARARAAEARDFREAARILSEWDLVASADSPGAALYEAFYGKMVENLLADDLGPELFAEAVRAPRIVWNVMDRVIARGDSPLLEERRNGRRETLDALAARSILDAMAVLKHRLGGAASTWRWGRLHQVSFDHPFGRKRYLRRWFDIGPSPAPGDGMTVWKGEFLGGGDFSVVVGPAMRQIVPLGLRRNARSVISTGQSGHFFEPHYRDQAPLWLSGKTRPVWIDPADVAANAESRLRLVPKAQKAEGRS